MVYIHSWQDYQEAAESLYLKSPNNTRYCVKWKGSDGKLVLKITDDEHCIKFKTYSSIFLNRFESLNLSLIQKMQNQKSQPVPAAPTPSAQTQDGQKEVAVSPAPAAASTASGGGVKKKKPKKKK